MARRTELGESPWKTDDRTVRQWLDLSDRELGKVRDGLSSRQRGDVLDEHLDLLADGKTSSIVVRIRSATRIMKRVT